MRDRYFLDTNIFVYSFDMADTKKRERSQELIVDALGGAGIVSWQVVQEFSNVATKKFARAMSASELQRYLSLVLLPLCEVVPDSMLYLDAVGLHARAGFSFYDALIVESALRGGCTVLYTEDLQSGFSIAGLRIQNPFV